VYDYLPEVAERYLSERSQCQLLEIWQLNRQVARVKPGYTLRIQIPESFNLQWLNDNGRIDRTVEFIDTCLGINYVDLKIEENRRSPIYFKFTEDDRVYQIDIIV
jgi:glucoamylase